VSVCSFSFKRRSDPVQALEIHAPIGLLLLFHFDRLLGGFTTHKAFISHTASGQ